MNYAIVNLKVDLKTKKEAQRIAEEIGVPLSTLLKSYIKQLIRTKRVSFDVSEEPSEYLLKAIRESEEDLEKNEASPIFDDPKKAIDYLHKQIK
ncbi:MAG: type II toxin-antitoxin system RelB/DinJ family antitoxin [Candidatus Levybacteria bacterium]|nr:type II toxin-antitoxin system RelB/DinJ family antitoxin [Candidatus Levybacteria bacterium]